MRWEYHPDKNRPAVEKPTVVNHWGGLRLSLEVVQACDRKQEKIESNLLKLFVKSFSART